MWCLSFFFVTEFAHEQSPDAEVLRKPMPRGCSLVLSRMLRETLLSDMGLVSRACRGGCLLSRAVWRLFLFIQPVISCSGSPSAAVRKTSGKIPVLMDDLNRTGVLLHKTAYGSGPAAAYLHLSALLWHFSVLCRSAPDRWGKKAGESPQSSRHNQSQFRHDDLPLVLSLFQQFLLRHIAHCAVLPPVTAPAHPHLLAPPGFSDQGRTACFAENLSVKEMRTAAPVADRPL